MICAKVVSNTLQVIDLAPGEACQFVTLLQQSDFANPEAFLTKEIVFTLLSAAAGVYGLVFVIDISLRQLGFRG